VLAAIDFGIRDGQCWYNVMEEQVYANLWILIFSFFSPFHFFTRVFVQFIQFVQFLSVLSTDPNNKEQIYGMQLTHK